MTIKKLGSAYKFRVGRATGNEHIFLFGLMCCFFIELGRHVNLSERMSLIDFGGQHSQGHD